MSLTSYRAAPPRDKSFISVAKCKAREGRALRRLSSNSERQWEGRRRFNSGAETLVFPKGSQAVDARDPPRHLGRRGGVRLGFESERHARRRALQATREPRL